MATTETQFNNKNSMKSNTWLNLTIISTIACLAWGCGGLGGNQRHRTANLSAYLYPAQTGAAEPSALTRLSLPLRVGIAFVPGDAATSSSGNAVFNANAAESSLTEKQKLDLMKSIRNQLSQYPSIASADLIPNDFMTPHGGFADLDRIRTLRGVDVILLLSYDQSQFTDEGALTLSYWTVIGMYVVPAEKNETKTVLEAAVYDIPSRKLLFRASGSGEFKGSATPVNLSEQLRVDSVKCLDQAATNLVASLSNQIDQFGQKIAGAQSEIKIERQADYRGGPFGE